MACICGAETEGASIGSSELKFSPGKVKGGRYHLDVGTAGSITLVLQACMLASAQCKEDFGFEIVGGTNVKWSPPIDFYQWVLFPQLATIGGVASIGRFTRGFYPEGGGKVEATWKPPASFAPLKLVERGELKSISGIIFVQGLPGHIASRIGSSIRKNFLNVKMDLKDNISQGRSKGAGAFLFADFDKCRLSGDSLGERGVAAEVVGQTAADRLLGELGSTSTIDVHSADQLLPYLCLAEHESSFFVKEVTGHLSSQADLLGKFLGAEVLFVSMERGTRVDVRPSRTCS